MLGHFRGLTWADVRSLPLRDYNALVAAMERDVRRQKSADRSGTPSSSPRRSPRLT